MKYCISATFVRVHQTDAKMKANYFPRAKSSRRSEISQRAKKVGIVCTLYLTPLFFLHYSIVHNHLVKIEASMAMVVKSTMESQPFL